MQPPQDPYSSSAFPGPNDPLPSTNFNPGGPGSPPISPTGVPLRGPEISFDVISDAWTAIQPHLGTYIGAAVVILIFGGVFQGLQIGLTPARAPNGQQEFNAAATLVGLLGNLVYQLMGAGMMRMSINHLKSGRPDFGQMLSVIDVLPSLVGAGILVGLLTVLGSCACLVPGLLLAGLYLFVTPLIVDRRFGPIQAMRVSFNSLKPQMWMALLFTFVIGLVAGAGTLACCVGLVVTIPLAAMSIAITYRNFFDSPGGSVIATPNFPIAPIADPNH